MPERSPYTFPVRLCSFQERYTALAQASQASPTRPPSALSFPRGGVKGLGGVPSWTADDQRSTRVRGALV